MTMKYIFTQNIYIGFKHITHTERPWQRKKWKKSLATKFARSQIKPSNNS